MIGAFRTAKEMEDTNRNKENHKHHNDTTNDQPKALQSREGEPLDTINGPIPNERANAKNLERKNSSGAPFNEHRSRHQSLFRVSSEDSDDSPFDDFDEVGRMMPGVLAEGVAYTVKETLNQGYIEKKGSGFDWIGSRAWKKRWAVLVKARTDGQDVDVPLLQIFWDYHSPAPSTVISLDSTVLLPENNLDPSKPDNNHPYCFTIRHVKKSVNPDIDVQLTRIIGCAKENERDEWVYAINQALLQYEKEKANAKLSLLSPSPQRGNSRSWANEDIMPKANPTRQRTVSSPPRIPLSVRKENR
mmetsp:Transcript_6030/g.14615  ORF Transcript_6030/g.14615 Transcript_6030/m.14615 type:complete len:302 (-) Transcript_6030:142-1047(-)